MKCLTLLMLIVGMLGTLQCGDSAANNSSYNANANIVRPTQTPGVNAVNVHANSLPTPKATATALPTPTPTTEKPDEGLFSFPPPKATSYTLLKSEDLRNPAGPTTFDFVSRKIASGLEEAGYMPEQQFGYFWNNQDEFAIVTAMERIESDGTPLVDSYARWNGSENLPTASEMGEYFRYLFRGKIVYYRVFAFVVTSKRYGSDLRRNSPPDFQTARNWAVEKGEAQLGSGEGTSEIESAIFDGKYRCYALLYLFVNHTSIDGPLSVDVLKGSDLRLVEGLDRQVASHLAKTNINVGGTRDEP